MIASRRRKLVAVLVAIVLAGVPTILLNWGLNAYVERHGREEASLAARQAVARVEWRLDQAIVGLSGTPKAFNFCTDVNPDVLRQAIASVIPVKELSIVDVAGTAACDYLDLASRAWPLSTEVREKPGSEVMMSVVRMPDHNLRALRLRWQHTSPLTLVALIPAEMFLPETTRLATPHEPAVRIMLGEGTMIGEAGTNIESDSDPANLLTARVESKRYPLVATASVTRAQLAEEFGELLTWGSIGIGVLVFLAVAFIIVAPWRKRDNPISDIERGLSANEFVPYYQPIVDIATGRILGAEVLVRWRKADGTIVPPASFIPLAESSGLIIDLTRALMQRVRDQAGAALGRRPTFKIGFNLSARHFDDNAIVEDIYEIFGDSPIRMTQVLVEVTERQPLANLATARRVIAELQELGVKVAIDDVGTGHGGLSYMLKLGVDVIKIDKMFVDAIGAERYSTTIIETLVELARNMRMEIVAEGVENFEQVAYLREHGIHQAQGYVFAPPLPGSSFLELIDAIDPLTGVAPTPETEEPPLPASSLSEQAA